MHKNTRNNVQGHAFGVNTNKSANNSPIQLNIEIKWFSIESVKCPQYFSNRRYLSLKCMLDVRDTMLNYL